MFRKKNFLPKMFCAGEGGTCLKIYLRVGYTSRKGLRASGVAGPRPLTSLKANTETVRPPDGTHLVLMSCTLAEPEPVPVPQDRNRGCRVTLLLVPFLLLVWIMSERCKVSIESSSRCRRERLTTHLKLPSHVITIPPPSYDTTSSWGCTKMG